MTVHDLYLLSPELAIVGLAVALVLVDLVLVRKGLLVPLALAGLAVSLAFTVALWADLGRQGVAEMPGVFGTLVVDRFSLFFKSLFIILAAVVVLVSNEYTGRLRRFQGEYYALILFSASGMMLLASTLELVTIYISLELTALPLAALAAFLRDGRSSESGVKFLVLSALSSAVLLYGMVLVYGFTGTTVLAEIGARIGEMSLDVGVPFGSHALLFGVVLIIAGFGFKIAMVPFQMWVPDVYEGSPTPITAFLSVASKAAGFAVILRVFYVAFPLDLLSMEWSALFAVLAALSMTVGNLVAIPQRNIKRMLAYSTVAHAGYILVGLAAAAARQPTGEPVLGPSGVLFYLAGYGATNLAVFAAIIAVSNRVGSDLIEDYAGMGRRSPLLAAALLLGLVSLVGLPPTVGFMAKLYIFGAGINAGLEWLVVVGVVNSAISAYYYMRVARVMYLEPPVSAEPVRPGVSEGVALLMTSSAILVLGVFPGPLLSLAKTAVQVFL